MTDDRTYRLAVQRGNELERERDAALAECEGLRADAERWQVILKGNLYQGQRSLYSAICEGVTADEINAAADAARKVKP